MGESPPEIRDKRWTPLFGVGLVLMAAAVIAVRLAGTFPIETDILQALPGDGGDRVIADAVHRAGAVAGNRLTLAVRGGDDQLRAEAARDLTSRLTGTDVFVPVADEGRDLAEWLFTNRAEILCPEDERRLAAGRGGDIARNALVRLYTPGTPLSGELLSRDPFLLSLRLGECLPPRSPDVPGHAIIVAGRLSGSPYRLEVQDRVVQSIEDWKIAWAERGLVLDRSGAVFHAHAGGIRARTEISIIGGAGTVAIAVLFCTLFARLIAPLLAVATVFAGLSGGLAATLLAFESVHAIALVFGAALTGIAADYAIHFMMTGFAAPGQSGGARLRRIRRPMTVSLITSVCGFLAILWFSIPVMSQIAVFAAGGLVTAWIFAVTVLPALDRRSAPPTRAAKALASFAAWLLRPRLSGWPLALGVLVLVAGGVAGMARLTVLDDVQAFQRPPADLKIEEERIGKLTGFRPSTTLLLSSGADYDAARQAEERALAALSATAAGGTGGDGAAMFAISRFDPPAETRHRNRALLETGLLAPHLASHADGLGLATADPYGRPAATGGAPELPAPLRGLHGVAGGSHYLIAPLGAEATARLLRDASASGPNLGPGVSLIDPAERYSEVMKEYRRLATLALLAAIAACGLILLAAYRDAGALRILLPPVLAVAGATALLGLAGVPFSFFSAAALLIVLGTGIDFAVFRWETSAQPDRWVLAAVVLAASTSILSMGLLGISTTYPVRAFGLTVATGVGLSMILSSLARNGVQGGRDGS
jgi:predicted exporter